MSRALLLWDVDHTLIENGGVSKENYAHAFMLLTGRPAEQQPQTDGRTDIGIMERLLQANDVDPALYPWAAQANSLIEAGEHNRTAFASRGYALPGAAAILARLSMMPDVVQSVLTGNIAENAHIKLAAFGLDKWIDFTVGGFGSESSVRGELVRVAQGKAADKYGVDPAQDVTVVVGDTPLDVEAGLVGGARVIGVATGLFPAESLQEAGAHATLAGLADGEAFVSALSHVRSLDPGTPRYPRKNWASGLSSYSDVSQWRVAEESADGLWESLQTLPGAGGESEQLRRPFGYWHGRSGRS